MYVHFLRLLPQFDTFFVTSQGTKMRMTVCDGRILHPVASFRRNCPDILQQFGRALYYDGASFFFVFYISHPYPWIIETSTSYQQFLPHPLRRIANGRPVYSVPLIIFQDDVSANRSKQWNKHYVIYMSNAALPRKEMNKKVNIKFVGSSPHAQPLDMMGCVMQMCEWVPCCSIEILVHADT
jgi:hypothetical protein